VEGRIECRLEPQLLRILLPGQPELGGQIGRIVRSGPARPSRTPGAGHRLDVRPDRSPDRRW
jgi:hypothetical protein